MYGSPAPEGCIPLQVDVVAFEGLDTGRTALPKPRPFRVEGQDDGFLVHEGNVEATIPFNIVPFQETATLSISVRYQACTDSICYPPDDVSLDLTLNGVDLVRD